MLYYQMPLYFFVGALLCLNPDVALLLMVGYIGLATWVRHLSLTIPLERVRSYAFDWALEISFPNPPGPFGVASPRR